MNNFFLHYLSSPTQSWDTMKSGESLKDMTKKPKLFAADEEKKNSGNNSSFTKRKWGIVFNEENKGGKSAR